MSGEAEKGRSEIAVHVRSKIDLRYPWTGWTASTGELSVRFVCSTWAVDSPFYRMPAIS